MSFIKPTLYLVVSVIFCIGIYLALNNFTGRNFKREVNLRVIEMPLFSERVLQPTVISYVEELLYIDMYDVLLLENSYFYQEGIQTYEENKTFDVPLINHRRINDNYIGVLYIPYLGIQYPLYFTGCNFHLRRDYRGVHSTAGELFIDGRSPGNLFRLDNLINGHNMRDGTKFGTLSNIIYATDDIYMYIQTYPLIRTFRYRLLAVIETDRYESGVFLDFYNLYYRERYYRDMMNSSLIYVEIEDLDRPIITLNTCHDNIRNGHLLVAFIMEDWI